MPFDLSDDQTQISMNAMMGYFSISTPNPPTVPTGNDTMTLTFTATDKDDASITATCTVTFTGVSGTGYNPFENV